MTLEGSSQSYRLRRSAFVVHPAREYDTVPSGHRCKRTPFASRFSSSITAPCREDAFGVDWPIGQLASSSY